MREVWAWSMYDFANSGYTTVVITAVFSAYFVAGVAGKAPWATFAWTAALSVSYLAVLLTAPLLGAYADAHAAKKKLLLFSTAGCVLLTAALYFTGPGTVALAIALIIAVEFLLRHGREPDRRLPHRARRLQGHGPRLRLGLGLRLPGRPGFARHLARLHPDGRETGREDAPSTCP